jgi:hypothetical protein
MVAANGQPIEACTHIINDQLWREHNDIYNNHTGHHDNRHCDPHQG